MKILLIYASKHGCTKDTAELLLPLLPAGADIHDMARPVPDVAEYDAVILGGPVYAGMLPKEVKQFAERQREALLTKKLGLFVCSSSDEAAALEALTANLGEELVQHAAAAANFGGELRRDKLNFFEKGILKMVAKAQPGRPEPEIDKDAIARFAAVFGDEAAG